MTPIITLEEAQTHLKELVEKLGPGEEIIITRNHQSVARLIGEHSAPRSRPSPGLGKGSILYIAPDFDEPPEEFKEYMK